MVWRIFQERHPYRWKVKHNLLRLSSISLLFNQLRGYKPGLKSSAKTWRQESRLRANWLWDDTLSTVGFEVTSPWNVKSKYEKSESENNRKKLRFFELNDVFRIDDMTRSKFVDLKSLKRLSFIFFEVSVYFRVDIFWWLLEIRNFD